MKCGPIWHDMKSISIKVLTLLSLVILTNQFVNAEAKVSAAQIKSAQRKCANMKCKSGCGVVFTEKSARAYCVPEGGGAADNRTGQPVKTPRPPSESPYLPGTQCKQGGEACGNGCCYPPRSNCVIINNEFRCVKPNDKNCEAGQTFCGFIKSASGKSPVCCDGDSQFCSGSRDGSVTPTCISKCDSENDKYCGAKQSGGFVCCGMEDVCVHAPSGRDPYCCPLGTSSPCRGLCCKQGESCAYDPDTTSGASSCCNNETDRTCGSSCCQKELLCNAKKSECKQACEPETEVKCGDFCCDSATQACDITGKKCIPKPSPTPAVPPTPPYPPGNAVVCTGESYNTNPGKPSNRVCSTGGPAGGSYCGPKNRGVGQCNFEDGYFACCQPGDTCEIYKDGYSSKGRCVPPTPTPVPTDSPTPIPPEPTAAPAPTPEPDPTAEPVVSNKPVLIL